MMPACLCLSVYHVMRLSYHLHGPVPPHQDDAYYLSFHSLSAGPLFFLSCFSLAVGLALLYYYGGKSFIQEEKVSHWMIKNTFEVDVHCAMTCTDLVIMEGKEGCVLYVLTFHALVSSMYSPSLSLHFYSPILLYLTCHALAVIHVYPFFSISFFPSLHSSSPLFLTSFPSVSVRQRVIWVLLVHFWASRCWDWAEGPVRFS